MQPLRLTGLVCYPIKGAAGISADSWTVDSFGLEHDRRWMVVGPAGRQFTQRDNPLLARVRPRIRGGCMTVEASGTAPLELPFEPGGGSTVSVSVWDDRCEAEDLGEEPARWFSRYLGTSCRLVYMANRMIRLLPPTYAPAGSRVSFADAFPFLLISEESLGDLNTRLARPLPMNRFRPNLVIAGGEPFLEDRIGRFRIGDIGFEAVKPCARCVVTTTDQETAERGKEPLRTLATFRRVDGEVMFGQNVVHASTGRLAVGAPVLI